MNALFRRGIDSTLDLVMCGMMNGIQMRHHLPPGSLAELEKYIADNESLSFEQYYNIEEPEITASEDGSILRWASPVTTSFRENNSTHIDLYPCNKGWTAPTVIMLHALMSVSDEGYKEWAKKFNEQGWNACFVHLPYHYSRVPRGYFNGELAIGPDLLRTGEGLRQAVIELRQLMQYLRSLGCPGFGLWATSYGGWIGALLSFVERDFRFIALMSPIVNINHAIWQSPGSLWMRYQLRRHRIEGELIERHFRLISPMHNVPLCGGERTFLTTGLQDLTSPPEHVEQLHKNWSGSELMLIPQGHYGYRIMPETLQRLIDRGSFA